MRLFNFLAAGLLGLVACQLAAAGDRPRKPTEVAAAIDREIDKRLAEKKLPASPKADDAEFLRRATIDVTGRIPTVKRTLAFLADKDPHKRARLIDELLADVEYGRHFATRWHHLLIPLNEGNARPLSGPLYSWLQKKFNSNAGWDQVVADVLTARGSILTSPQIQFYVVNSQYEYPQPDQLASAVSRLFLGVQLQCAQCHDHPFAPWKQTDFWGLAAFFSRTGVMLERGAANVKGLPFTLVESDKILVYQQPVAPFVRPDASIQIPGKRKVVKARFLNGELPKLAAAGPYRPVLAGWITSAKNPYFAKAAVNRLWGHFFARGLVHPVADFRSDNPPSHPALLRLLAREFVSSGFDQKHLIRCICKSRTYGRTSRPVKGNERDVELFSKMAVKMMAPEVFYDSIQIAAGGDAGKGADAGRRRLLDPGRGRFVGMYTSANQDAEPTAYSHGIPQVLELMNHPNTLDQNAPTCRKWEKALKEGKATRTQVIEALYLAALSRRPRPRETQLFLKNLKELDDPNNACLAVLWVLINSSEFVLNH